MGKKPSELRTAGRVVKEKSVGEFYQVFGFLLFFGGLVGAFGSSTLPARHELRDPAIVLCLFLVAIGILLIIIGAQKKKKAQFISWTREALEKHDYQQEGQTDNSKHYCQSCGKSIDKSCNFCPYCGEQIHQA